MSMTFFAYTCQIQLLPIYSELVNPSYKRIRKVINRSISVDFFFYFVIAAAGYFSQFDKTAQIVLEREFLPGKDMDYPLMISIFALIVCILVAFPINYNPWRQQLFTNFLGMEEYSQTANAITTLLFTAFTCIVSILFPNISQVISIMGGLCASTMCYLIPLIILLKLSKKPLLSFEKIVGILFFGSLVTMGYLSVVVTVIEIVKGESIIPHHK
uniref:Amino acid transporter transmembrane domain-containing protein n=1 Tax=Strombidium inclinatum TaxID=197538 RepID=A0A7S3MZG2_9SPIT|mmetsp:Transcript_31693/g.48527  ORF Transcript_31693/g.48527 Transcript_31693/m.48527 type:complete len:214 (+) Transcript_31693:828-1469(+)